MTWKDVSEKFAQSGATLPMEQFSALKPLCVLEAEVSLIHADSDDGLKTVDSHMKDSIQIAKDFVGSVKGTVKHSAATLRAWQSEQVKKARAVDKSREDTQKLMATQAKANLKEIKARCKDADLPGLLTFCGAMIEPMPTYDSFAKFKEAANENKVQAGMPYVIAKVDALTTIALEPACHTAFTHSVRSSPKHRRPRITRRPSALSPSHRPWTRCALPCWSVVRRAVFHRTHPARCPSGDARAT